MRAPKSRSGRSAPVVLRAAPGHGHAEHPLPDVTPPSSPPDPASSPEPEGRGGFLGFGRRRGGAKQPPASLAAARRQVADMQKRLEKVEAALTALRRDLSAAAAERDQLRQRAAQMDTDLANERDGHALAQLQLREARDKWAESERAGGQLQQALRAEQDARQQWEAAANDRQARFAALQQQWEALSQQHSALEIAHAAEKRDHEQFEALAGQRGAQLERLDAEHTALRQAHQELTALHQAEQQAHAYFESLSADKAAALDALTADHAVLQQQHEELAAAHAEEQRQHELAEITAAAHATKIEGLQGELAATRETLAGTEAALLELQQAHTEATASVADLSQRLEALGGQHEQLTAQHQSLAAAHAEMTEMHAAEQNARQQWEAHAKELTDTLTAEREEYQSTLEDERRTAEAARAQQAFQHREEMDRLVAQHTAVLTATQGQLADTRSTLEATTAELGATRADVQRLTEDLQASRGESEAANLRAREESELRQAADKRRMEVEEELDYVRSEVMGGAGDRGRKRGLLRRGKTPLKAAEQLPRSLVHTPDEQPPSGVPAEADEEVADIIERRLFGDG